MSLASRGTRVAARSLRSTRLAQPTRRHASDSHGHGHGHGHAHGESALHLKSANTTGNESLGSGLFATLAFVPLFYAGYTLAYGSDDNVFARLYLKYKEGKQASADADLLHQTVMAQAISDQASLSSYPRDVSGPELKNPEMFNSGSPWFNVPGESSADLTKLEEHYRKVRAEVEQERITRIKDGQIKSVYD